MSIALVSMPVGAGGKGYLLIDLGEDAAEHRWLLAGHLLEVVVRFWRNFFRLIAELALNRLLRRRRRARAAGLRAGRRRCERPPPTTLNAIKALLGIRIDPFLVDGIVKTTRAPGMVKPRVS